MRKSVLLIMIIIVALSSSCALQNKTVDSDSGKLTKISIQLDGSATPYYVPLYIAKSKGWFAEEGLDVEFYYSSAVEIIKNVAMNNVQFGFPNSDPVIIGRGNEVPVKIIHSTYQQGLGAIMFKKRAEIRSPKDLKGKTIAITSFGSPNFIQLQMILKQYGMTVDDVHIKIIGTGAIVNALVTNQVDGICFSMLRKYDLKEQGIDVLEFRLNDYIPISGNVLITSEKFLKENRAICQSMNKVIDRSLNFLIYQDGLLESVNTAINDFTPAAKQSEDLVMKVIKNEFISHLWQSDNTAKYGFGYSDLEKYNSYIRILDEYGLIEESYSAEKLIVNFCEEKK